MEIEAKFAITTAHRLQWLQRAQTLLGHPLQPKGVSATTDLYLDTQEMQLGRHGLSLRIRQLQTGSLATLKSLYPNVWLLPNGENAPNATATEPLSIGGSSIGGSSIGGSSIGHSQSSLFHTRQELEEPMNDLAAIDLTLPLPIARFPMAVQQILVQWVGEQATFLPLCLLHQQRIKRWVQPAHPKKKLILANHGNGLDSKPIAELSVDEVQVYAPEMLNGWFDSLPALPAAEPNATHNGWIHNSFFQQTLPAATFAELELELTDSSAHEPLQNLAQRCAIQSGLTVNLHNKLQIALEQVREYEIAQCKGTESIHSFCQVLWRKQLFAMLGCEAGVRYGSDPEAIHEMRVAIRRIRAAARLFGDFFEQKALKKLLVPLRQTAHLLGIVRDLDVAIERLNAHRLLLTEGEQSAIQPLITHWQAVRQAHHQALCRWLADRPYQQLVEQFLRFCQPSELDAHDKVAKETKKQTSAKKLHALPVEQTRHILPAILLQRYGMVQAYEPLLAPEESPHHPVATLHALRIQCKYLRYSLEFASAFLGENGKRLVTQLKLLQDQLGEINDAAVCTTLLESLPEALQTPSVQGYDHHQASIMAEKRGLALQALRQFIAPNVKHTLLQGIGKL